MSPWLAVAALQSSAAPRSPGRLLLPLGRPRASLHRPPPPGARGGELYRRTGFVFFLPGPFKLYLHSNCRVFCSRPGPCGRCLPAAAAGDGDGGGPGPAPGRAGRPYVRPLCKAGPARPPRERRCSIAFAMGRPVRPPNPVPAGAQEGKGAPALTPVRRAPACGGRRDVPRQEIAGHTGMAPADVCRGTAASRARAALSLRGLHPEPRCSPWPGERGVRRVLRALFGALPVGFQTCRSPGASPSPA